MNDSPRIDPVAEYAACCELAALNIDVGNAIEARRQMIRRYLDRPGVRSHVLARQLGISRATLYRWADDTSAFDAAHQRRLPVVDGPEAVIDAAAAKPRARASAAAAARADRPARASDSPTSSTTQPGGQAQPAKSPRPKAATSATKRAAKPAAKRRRQSAAGTTTKTASSATGSTSAASSSVST